MPSRKFISRFSPGRTSPEDLEAIFVQREPILKDAVERVVESVQTKNKHHLLFIGARGSGKTHLLTLLFHRLGKLLEIQKKLCIAWLNEDETSRTFFAFLKRIYTALAKQQPGLFLASDLDPILDLPRDQAAQRLGNLLVEKLNGRTLLVLVENLDLLFEAFGVEGQRDLRAFIQNHGNLSLVATSQRLFPGISKRDAPFFGSFQTTYLKFLNFDEAVSLLENIARLNGDNELARFLATPKGRSRIRALHHLSGGNHRVYIILSEFISRETLDQLVQPFEELIDSLTPYYQERLRSLPPLQREIVEYLSSIQGATPVKEIARHLSATHPTISSQLKQLREMGYAESHAVGRESLYELAEPLMRLCLEVKETQQDRPLRLIVDFLRIWYDQDKLQTHLDRLPKDSRERICVYAALERLRSDPVNPRVRYLLNDLEKSKGDPFGKENIEVLRQLAAESPIPNNISELCKALRHRSVGLMKENKFAEALETTSEVIESPLASLTEITKAYFLRGLIHGKMGKFTEEIFQYERVIGLPQIPVVSVANALISRAIVYSKLNRVEDELEDYGRVLALHNVPVKTVTKVLMLRGLTFSQNQRYSEAIIDFGRVIGESASDEQQVAEALNFRAAAYSRLNQKKEERDDCTRVIELNGAPLEEVARALVNRGLTYSESNQREEAILDYSRAVDMAGSSPEITARALVNRGLDYVKQGRFQEALADYSRVIELPGVSEEGVVRGLMNRGAAYAQLAQFQDALTDFSRAAAVPAATTYQICKSLLCRGLLFQHCLNDNKSAVSCFMKVLESKGSDSEACFDAHWSLAEIEMAGSNLESGISHLRSALILSGSKDLPESAKLEFHVHSIAMSSQREEAWNKAVPLLVSTFSEENALRLLAEGLVRSLKLIYEAKLNQEGLETWKEVWRANVASYSDLHVAFRIFSVGIEYLTTLDESVFLQIPKEERSILREALSLGPQTSVAE